MIRRMPKTQCITIVQDSVISILIEIYVYQFHAVCMNILRLTREVILVAPN